MQPGRHLYVFDTTCLRWFTGRLAGFRIDPAGAPGEVSIKSIRIFPPTSGTAGAPGAPGAPKNAGVNVIYVPVSADQKQSLGPARDTFPDAPLIRYRLSSEFIDYALLDTHRGQSKVLQLHIRNSGKSSRSDALNFADAGFFSQKALKPFAPVIPPYVGLNAETFSIRILNASGDSGDAGALAGKSIRLEKASIAPLPPPLLPPPP
jgi:hypothetical protein